MYSVLTFRKALKPMEDSRCADEEIVEEKEKNSWLTNRFQHSEEDKFIGIEMGIEIREEIKTKIKIEIEIEMRIEIGIK